MLAFIISQDKQTIVPFNKPIQIKSMLGSEQVKITYDNRVSDEEDCVWLGVYKTEERAEEILGDIIAWYDILMTEVAQTDVFKSFYYKMPKE